MAEITLHPPKKVADGWLLEWAIDGNREGGVSSTVEDVLAGIASTHPDVVAAFAAVGGAKALNKTRTVTAAKTYTAKAVI